jgi:DnaJ-class molecular chaperone
MAYEILSDCESCGGDGIREHVVGNSTWGTESCPPCDGTGKYVSGTVDLSDLEDQIDDIINKCNDILEKVNE